MPFLFHVIGQKKVHTFVFMVKFSGYNYTFPVYDVSMATDEVGE